MGEEQDMGASFGPGSRPSDGAGQAVSTHAGFDPSRTSDWDDTDWHAFAQSISHHWTRPEDIAVAYQAAAEAAKALRAEMDRRDRNEVRNCLNWGPCSRNDGRMSEAETLNPRSGNTGKAVAS